MRNKLMMAFESLEDEEVVGTGTAVDAAAVTADAAQADKAAEIADVVDAVEELADGSEQMEGVTDRMEASLADDGEGYTPDAAAEATASLESLYRRVGLRNVRAMPALESFGSRNSRRATTKFAIEGIKEQVKRVWERIKKFFKEMWNKVKGYYNTVFDGATKLKNRAEAMLKKLEAESSSIKEASFEDETIAKQFSINGVYSADKVNAIVMGGKMLLKTANDSFSVIGNLATEIKNSVNEAKAEKTLKKAEEIKDSVTKNKRSAAEFGMPEGTEVGSVGPLLNDNEFVMFVSKAENYIVKDKDDKSAETKSIVMRASVISSSKGKTPASKVTTLKVNEMQTITMAVADLAELCLAFKSNSSKLGSLSKIYEDAVAEAEAIAVEEGVTLPVMSEIKSMLKGGQNVTAKIATFPLSNAIATGNAALGYCGASLAHYGTK